MIPRECKRLAEVDFPIAEVSRHAVREKSIRHGHPSTLHLWWARRPLASSRAMLMALLLPDPCDPLCPAAFKEKARQVLQEVRQPPADDHEMRRALLVFIAAFANWDMAAEPTYLRVARTLVRAAHGKEPPLVVDPFAGGGSIPLEALRLGCDAFASDLNPVACLILKVMLEDIPRHGQRLADEVRRAGATAKKEAKRELADLYPKDTDGATPIAYLWARTVRCEAPDCGAEIPLMRSFWLCKKKKRKRALRPRVRRREGAPPHVEFEIFEPQNAGDVHGATVTRAKASCLCCNKVLSPERVRSQLATQRGGADVHFDEQGQRVGGARMTAVVTLRAKQAGRHYRPPTQADYAPIRKAQTLLQESVDEWDRTGREGPCPVPDEKMPPIGTLGFRVQRYGMLLWSDLFTARQKMALAELGANLTGANDQVTRPLSLALGKLADLANAICLWEPVAECPRNVLSNGRLKPAWDFAEGVPIGESSGSFGTCLANLVNGLSSVRGVDSVGQSEVAAAQQSPLPSESAAVWFTDPPYYDAFAYADLADFFFTWYRRSVPEHVGSDPFDTRNALTPKRLEAVHDESKRLNGEVKDRNFFEKTMAQAFQDGKRIVQGSGIASVVFAHKTTDGWEALLSGMTRGGWIITGSWPIATEQAHRLRARDSAALATSVHLVCRPRPNDAPTGDWADVLRELPSRVTDWMERLQGEGIRGADLVFACIGPALEIFSRYRAVETAEGARVGLPEYLEKVWEIVGHAALRQVLGASDVQTGNGLAGALEEDARLTALFLWTLQSTDATPRDGRRQDARGTDEEATATATTRGFSLPFDVVRRFAQPMGIDLDTWNGRIVGQKKGVVRLLPVAERARDLFGEDGAKSAADRIESDPESNLQRALFPEALAGPGVRPAKAKWKRGRPRNIVDIDQRGAPGDATTLDRIHAAMLLQADGHANALRALISTEQERGSGFLRLANALSALYPQGSTEKRLLDAMLLAAPR